MVKKVIIALLVFVLTSLVLYVLAKFLLSFNTEPTNIIGSFLDRTNIIIGLIAGICYYVWGGVWPTRRAI